MSSHATGHRAEVTVANHLQAHGFKIRTLNWKTKYCEIDIVAEKDQRIYFIEVKYRSKTTWGNGLDYITLAKLKRMRFAAEMWVKTYRWQGEYQLAAVSIDGTTTRFVDIDT